MKMRSISAGVLLYSIVLALTIASNAGAEDGNVIYVDIAGSGDYTSIQDAVDGSNPGDTIMVRTEPTTRTSMSTRG